MLTTMSSIGRHDLILRGLNVEVFREVEERLVYEEQWKTEGLPI